MIVSAYSVVGVPAVVPEDVARQDARFQRDEDRVLDGGRLIEQSQVPEHQDRRQQHGRRVDHVLARVLRRRPVHGLEDRDLVPHVRAGREAEPADQRAGLIRQDVPVHVRHHDHLELLGALDQLVRGVVDDDVPGLDLGVVGGHFLERSLHLAFGELQDVGLRRAGDLRPALAAGVLEREPRDPLGPLRADQLERLSDAGGLHVLDPGVEVLDVLAHHHQVDPAAAVGGLHPGHLTDRPNVGVGLEQLAERDVGRLLAEPDGCLERSLEGDLRATDRVHRLLRHAGGDALLEDIGAGVRQLPVDRRTGRLDDPPRCVDALGADPVAGDQRHGDTGSVFGHARLLDVGPFEPDTYRSDEGWPFSRRVIAGAAGARGLEPRLTGPEPVVLPLHHAPPHCPRTLSRPPPPTTTPPPARLTFLAAQDYGGSDDHHRTTWEGR